MTTSMTLLIVFLLSILPNSFMGNINNEQLSVAHDAYIIAVQEGISPQKFISLIYCESKLHRNARGDYRRETGRYMANGETQFWASTFYPYAETYRTCADYNNSICRMTLAAKMIRNGEANHWWHCNNKFAQFAIK